MNRLTWLMVRYRCSAVRSRIVYWAQHRDRGATAVEYGLLVALIAVGIVGAVSALGGKLDGMFRAITSEIPTSLPS
jgi:pilus assembly protein Flp/PilA